MFVFQSRLFDACRPCTREQFEAIIHSDTVKQTIARARKCLGEGDRQGYDAAKRSLPAFCFMASFDKNRGARGTRKEDTWRLQKAARLTGLVMLDVDHLEEDPREVFRRIPEHWLDDDCDSQILLAHVTPSGKGLRLVCKADARRGNLADNQQHLSTALGLACDKSVKNADRLSFAVTAADIIYLNNEIFNYQNDEYDKLFGENYRQGNSRAAQQAQLPTPVRGGVAEGRGGVLTAGGSSSDFAGKITDPTPAPPLEGRGVAPHEAAALEKDAESDYTYNGDKFKSIIEGWLKQHGTPKVGERHLSALKLAADLRYVCDNDAAAIKAVLLQAPFVQDIIKERGEKEIDDICNDIVTRKMNINMPKALAEVLKKSGVRKETPANTDEAGSVPMSVYAAFWERLKPLMTEVYDLAVYRFDDYNKLGGVFAAAAMFCTLMTRCWYRHFDGDDCRMNPQVYLIGDPASGKGEAEKIDRIIMGPIIAADSVGRQAEAEYKRQQKERSTSSKAQKGDALKRPEYCIRYLPSRTSNAVFFRRAKNAFEEVDGEKKMLHLYTFDSELDGNTTAQSSGAWIGKHDIELKAFHNEFTGVDFANNDSVNEIIQVFYNSVVTGTPVSLSRKVNMHNVNDGLCSRLATFRMVSDNYKMIAPGNRMVNYEKNCRLKQWAFKFDRLHGELPIKRLVDFTYKLCEESALVAEAEDDKVLDYLRKRAVFYATWFTVPRIMARAIERLNSLTPNPSPKGRGGNTSKAESSGKKRGMQGYCSPPYKGGDGGESSGGESGSSDWSSSVMSCVTVEDSDLEFARLIYDAVIYFQDFFFGSMLQSSWDNVSREQGRRQRRTNNAAVFASLGKCFTFDEANAALGKSNAAVSMQLTRWTRAGYIKRTKKKEYVKIVESF